MEIGKAATPRFVLGIDGGQTGTTCLLADTDGAILGRGSGGHLVHLAQPDGPALMQSAFRQAIAGAWTAAQLPSQPCAAVYLGLSGVEAGTREAAAAIEIARHVVDAEQVAAANDAASALAGALLGKPGVVVIAGTGAIALGMTADGSEGFCGGWGWLIGDEGSACDIGRRGIQAATRAWDGRAPTTTLVERFANLFQVSHFFDLKRLVYAHSLDARLFADLAPVVARAAHDGDAVARAIAVDAGHELARLAAAVIQRLPFGPELVPVAPLGGVFRAGALIHDPFKRFLRRLEPRAQVVAPVLPATCGSVLLALKMCNRLDAAVIARLSSEARQRGWDSVE